MTRATCRAVDALLIIAGLAVLIAATFSYEFAGAANPYFISAFGLLTLTSKRFKDCLWVSRCLYWAADNIMTPRTPYNHIISGVVMVALGTVAFIVHIEPSRADGELSRRLTSSPSFWISIVLVLGANIAIGVWRSNRRKNQPNKAL